jgi:hypothetical protein
MTVVARTAAPSPYSSGWLHHNQGISKAGNSIVRARLVADVRAGEKRDLAEGAGFEPLLSDERDSSMCAAKIMRLDAKCPIATC